MVEPAKGVTGLWVTGLGVHGTVWRGGGAEAEAEAEAEGLDADAGVVVLEENGNVDCLAEALLPPPPVAAGGAVGAGAGVLLVFTGVGENFTSLFGNPLFGPCANEPTQSFHVHGTIAGVRVYAPRLHPSTSTKRDEGKPLACVAEPPDCSAVEMG